jgi:hypothetical protein
VATLSVGLFVGMVASLELGYRIGHERAAGDERAHEGLGQKLHDSIRQ